MAPYLKETHDGLLLSVKVQPRASRNEVGPAQGNELKVKVTAPPVDSAANQAVLELLAEKLDCPRNALQLVRGQTARHKVIALTGLTAEEVEKRLA
ncbi:MAG: DUF167 domain-containing protein [Verrucomicrobiota bacterium]